MTSENARHRSETEPSGPASPPDPSANPATPAEASTETPAREPGLGTRLWRSLRGRFGPPNAAGTGIPLWLSGLLFALGVLAPFCIMASDRRLVISVPVGFFGVLLATCGLCGALGSLGSARVSESTLAVRSLVVPLLRLTASTLTLILCGRAAVAGLLPAPVLSAGVLMTLATLWVVIEVYGVGAVIGVFSGDGSHARPLLRRHGFWLIALSTLLHMPMLGSFGLIDPWETHYGEVAREMLARDDWVSLWWAHDGWFWSKPIFNFWLQGLSFKLFGVQYMPDQMVQGVAHGHWPQPEWACRLPIFALATLGSYALYKGAAVVFGRKAAFVGSLILVTCPYWYLIGRQTMADMPYVAPVTAAMGMLLLGFHTDPNAEVRQYAIRFGRRTLSLNGFHLLFAAIALCALPQALYLISRNVTLHTGGDLFGFEPHLDQFMKGSGGGNCGQPGNAACRNHVPLHAGAQPFVLGLGWLAATVGLLAWYARERRRQVLYFLGAWLFTALAVMAKGAPGLVIPLAVAIVFPLVTGRFRELARLQFPALIVLLLAVALPWYVQMYMRHGQAFIDRLIFHDMVKRAFVHVHDTNKGDDTSFRYYIWQLGYGLFPWTGMAVLGLTWLGRSNERRDNPRWTANVFLLTWWLVAFGMFTITLTKFHHYIFPLVPPTAILAGVVLTRYLPTFTFTSTRYALQYYGALFSSAAAVCGGALLATPGNMTGRVTEESVGAVQIALGLLLIAGGLVTAYVVHFRGATRWTTSMQPASAPRSERQRYRSAMLSALALSACVPVFLAGRDMFTTRQGDVDGQARLLHLFTYNYDRKWPDSLEFEGTLLAFTLVCVGFGLGMAVRRWRALATTLFISTAGLFSLWCVNFYFVNVSPHWGQRETVLAYYQHRSSAEEPLVAYQMNWKGENFYTGNRMATFVSSGKKFKTWVTKQRETGKSTFFFTTEHTRIKNLKRELGEVDEFELLTDETLNNKFTLARAVFPPLSGNGADTGDDDEFDNDSANVGSQE